jgi:hypothetical protein
MRVSPEKLTAEAQASGFRPEVLEKVAHLLGLLNAMQSHLFLKGKLVPKGGTALNLFVFDVPRLSVVPPSPADGRGRPIPPHMSPARPLRS